MNPQIASEESKEALGYIILRFLFAANLMKGVHVLLLPLVVVTVLCIYQLGSRPIFLSSAIALLTLGVVLSAVGACAVIPWLHYMRAFESRILQAGSRVDTNDRQEEIHTRAGGFEDRKKDIIEQIAGMASGDWRFVRLSLRWRSLLAKEEVFLVHLVQRGALGGATDIDSLWNDFVFAHSSAASPLRRVVADYVNGCVGLWLCCWLGLAGIGGGALSIYAGHASEPVLRGVGWGLLIWALLVPPVILFGVLPKFRRMANHGTQVPTGLRDPCPAWRQELLPLSVFHCEESVDDLVRRIASVTGEEWVFVRLSWRWRDLLNASHVLAHFIEPDSVS